MLAQDVNVKSTHDLFSRFQEKRRDKLNPPIIVAFGIRECLIYLRTSITGQNHYLCSLRQSYDTTHFKVEFANVKLRYLPVTVPWICPNTS